MVRQFGKLLLAALTALLVFACGNDQSSQQRRSGARNVILFVGDGLGSTQTSLGLQFARLVEDRELNIESLMHDENTGYALPWPYGSIVTDSAAAATQFATGQLVRDESVGLDPDGYPLETIVEWAHARGLATGLVTNMRVTHATPAAFAAHQGSRYVREEELMDDILLDGDVDVILGGGARALVPAGTLVSASFPNVPPELDGESNRSDETNRVEEAEAQGYVIVSDADSLLAAAPDATKLLGLFSASHLPYVVDRRQMKLSGVPTLAQLASAAIDVLSRRGDGFFLLVEGGRIDYAGHANDAGSMLQEILDFDEAVGKGLSFQRANPETLVLVTGDHGTGGFSFTYGDFGPVEGVELESGVIYEPDHWYPGTEPLVTLSQQTASLPYIAQKAGSDVHKLMELVREHTGLELTVEEAQEALARDENGLAWTKDFRPFYGDPEDNASALIARALSRQTYVVWSTGGHTTDPVPTYGRGPGAQKLRGVYPNTHLYSVMREALEATR